MSKLPSFQFYPGDWQKDANLRRCSHAAKGVWVDMLCLMFECGERGVLISGDRPWTLDEVCAAVGGEHGATRACIAELLDKGVARKDSRGAILSARMVRDEQIRQARCNAGKKGGLAKSWQTSSKPLANTLAKSGSSSSSSSSDENKDKTPPTPPLGRGEGPGEASGGNARPPDRPKRPPKPAATATDPPIPAELDTPEFRAAWGDWLAMRREKRKPATPTAARVQLAKLERMGLDRALDAVRFSTGNGWDGIFEDKNGQQSPGNRTAPKPAKTAADRGQFAEASPVVRGRTAAKWREELAGSLGGGAGGSAGAGGAESRAG